MKSQSFTLLLLATLTGCLSMDGIPVAETDAAVAMRDAGVRDATAADARVLAPDATADAEVDAAIDPSGPVPACSPGITSACTFYDSGNPVLAGNYVYWIHPGTTDGFNNYQYDGALVRVRIGEWLKQNVVTGLDFYNEVQRTIVLPSLVGSDHYVVWYSSLFSGFVAVDDAAPVVQPLAWPHDGGRCRISEDTLLCDLDFADPETHGRRLDRDEPMKPVMGPYGSAWLVAGVLFGQNQFDGLRIDTVSGESQTFPPGATLIDALPGDRLVGVLADSRVGIAKFNGSMPLRWKGVAGPGNYVGTQGEWVYWSQAAGEVFQAQRSDTDGAHQQLVATRKYANYDYYYVMKGQLGAAGLLFARAAWPEGTVTSFDYIPLPAD